MNKQLVMIGKFGLYIPDELWFDVATLKIDLRPALTLLEEASPKPHQHKFKKYYNRMKCRGCGAERMKWVRL